MAAPATRFLGCATRIGAFLRLKLKGTAGYTVVSMFLVAAMCIADILIWPHL